MNWSETFYKTVALFDTQNHPIPALFALLILVLGFVTVAVMTNIGAKSIGTLLAKKFTVSVARPAPPVSKSRVRETVPSKSRPEI